MFDSLVTFKVRHQITATSKVRPDECIHTALFFDSVDESVLGDHLGVNGRVFVVDFLPFAEQLLQLVAYGGIVREKRRQHMSHCHALFVKHVDALFVPRVVIGVGVAGGNHDAPVIHKAFQMRPRRIAATANTQEGEYGQQRETFMRHKQGNAHKSDNVGRQRVRRMDCQLLKPECRTPLHDMVTRSDE